LTSARRHLFIPDTQVKKGVPTDHLGWIGQYVLDKKPDVVVHAGDHWDMPSLSSYDRGKKAMEGRRYVDDVEAGNRALALITAPLRKANWSRRKRGTTEYEPRLVLLRGNHEHRIVRAVEDDARMEGAISLDDLESPGWEVHDFLEPVFIDGLGYSHYWCNAIGKPIGGSINNKLQKLGHGFVAGHQQTFDYQPRFIHGPDGWHKQCGLVAGACYLHNEEYMGPQSNAHWRGVVMLNEVRDGGFDILEVSLDFLCRKYVVVTLNQFMARSH